MKKKKKLAQKARNKEQLVTIARFDHPAEAHVARTRLQASGIWSFVADEHMVVMNWLLRLALGSVKLQVKTSDVDRALEILGQEPYDPSLKGGAPRCPECQSFDVGYEKYAMRRVFAALLLFRMPIPFTKKKWKCRDCGYEWKAEGHPAAGG